NDDLRCLEHNARTCHPQSAQCQQHYQSKAQDDCPPRTPLVNHGFHYSAKNSVISWVGIAPSRMMRHGVVSLVRSMIVDEISRGEGPPSTMMEIRSCNCSRTCAAEVHSCAPLKLADVAVIGRPAA